MLKLAAILLTAVALAAVAACSSKGGGGALSSGDGGPVSSSGGDGGSGDGGASVALLVNPGVTQTCQTCLSGASGNDCSAQAKTCGNDSNCVALNTCVNKCTNLNAGCIQNCEDSASVNSGQEWSTWFSCACNDCATQCSECSASGTSSGGSGSSGGGSGSSSSGTASCQEDNSGKYFTCSQGNGFYCTDSDTPVTDGFATTCSAPSADPGGTGVDYCCN